MVRTHDAIIQSFAQLLDEKPLNKITVKDIVTRCDINRNTFYYHFADIPALVEEMMSEKVDHLIKTYYQLDQPIECIRPLIQYGLEHKRAVLHVYRYVDRELFLVYLNRLSLKLMQEYFHAATDGTETSGEAAETLIRFYKCAMVGLLLDWLDGNMKEDMLALTQRLCVLLEGMGKQALEKNI